ncbi:MAG TPA: DUF1800 domain-containing protein [Phycisphaerae bacterium]|nr:DUF1800 domain-containing protein [Phycisphaerae bacterium]
MQLAAIAIWAAGLVPMIAPPADPLKSSAEWTRDQAAHLLRRAGFGGTPEQIDFLHQKGRDGAVDYLVDFERIRDEAIPVRIEEYRRQLEGGRGLDREERQKRRMAVQQASRLQFARVTRWWVEKMTSSSRPLQEKLVLFWHGHFTSGFREVKSSGALYQQNQLFRRNAHGNFRSLLLAVTEDPAMIIYLNTQQNRKGKPNENYARELMELFTMGEGEYTERDIKEAARAFTGISIDRRTGKSIYRANQHDFGKKTFLGKTGDFHPADIIDIILEQPATAEYMARKFWEFFAYENPEPEIVHALADTLRKNRYEIKPMLTAMFRSDAFYSQRARFTHIKSPIELLVGTMRTLEITPVDTEAMVFGLQTMGQTPMQPPNVKGWDGGETWITSSTLFNRYNVLGRLLTGTKTAEAERQREQRLRRASRVLQAASIDIGDDDKCPTQPVFDPMPIVRAASVKSCEELADLFINRLLQRKIAPERRQTVIDAIRQHIDDRNIGDAKNADAIRGMIHLIVSMPEYQLS